jgi:uncharacterized protein YecT (DUF1311 family)
MGFFFRRSIKFGPFRINFSKSGIGASVGVRGFRTGVSSTGRRTTRVSIPGTGVGYQYNHPKEQGEESPEAPMAPREVKGQPVLLFVVLLGMLGIILWAASAQAQQRAKPAPAKSSYDVCMERAQTNVDFQDCGSAEITRLETKLAATWKAAYGSIVIDSSATEETRRSKKALLEEQRAWIRYKDRSCVFWAHDNGTMGQTNTYSCRIDVLKERERHLREQLLQPLPR